MRQCASSCLVPSGFGRTVAGCLGITILLTGHVTPVFADRPSAVHSVNFDRQIAPLLAERCLGCHDGREHQGGLNLTTQRTALAGGESGVVIVPRNAEESLLWRRIAAEEMPPKQPLSAAERTLLRNWLSEGAAWGTDPIDPWRYTTATRAGTDWWSWQPLAESPPPRADDAWIRTPIDAFVREKLRERQLRPSEEADRRTLIRRLSFDLLGLPPTPDEVERFVADRSPAVYEALVDRLLSSPHYGERWGRHWLDVARFGESQGFERDKLRPNSWPYRDWVIDALNRDLPYDEFVRLQLAGDVLFPDDAAAITATGFLVAGAYDEVGQKQQSAAMRAVVREDELEDIVGTVSQAFLGLTVNCARCHDHKFDPITQTDYYRLSAALGGVRHGERKVSTEQTQRKVAELGLRQDDLRQRVAAVLDRAREFGPAARDSGSGDGSAAGAPRETRAVNDDPGSGPVAVPAGAGSEASGPAVSVEVPEPVSRWTFEGDLEDDLGKLHGRPHGGARVARGRLQLDGAAAYVSTAPLTEPLTEKTLEVWLVLPDRVQRGGGVMSVQTNDGSTFDAIVYGEREPGRWLAGSNHFQRTQPLDGAAESAGPEGVIHLAAVYAADGTISVYRDGILYGRPYRSTGPARFEPGQSHVLFGMRHGTQAGGNRMLAAEIEQAHLYDRALTPQELAASAASSEFAVRTELLARLSPDERSAIRDWEAELGRIAQQLESLESESTYAVTPAEPGVTHVLLRGNPATPAEAVAPGAIASLTPGDPTDAADGRSDVSGAASVRGTFGLPADAPEAERRRRLARWMIEQGEPLVARVIVNRVWQHHFGTGLVDTPNDLGFSGGRPTHPELLDDLARRLIASGWSLKSLHRLMVTSATYRQSSQPRDEGLAVDAGNRWLWRYAPRRLEAETLRDSILAVAGELNPQVGGPPYRDFETFTFNSQFYEMIDPVDFESQRRTIYRTWLRSGRNRLLDAFDCPDPSTTAPRRAVTTTPTQSLSLLNNSFVLRMSDRLAARVRAEAGQAAAAQVERVAALVWQRAPTAAERPLLEEFVSAHGLAPLCRVLMGTNEFLFVQ